ncbi:MAG: hypothetical protein ABI743_03895, partial [bacterium]
MLTRLAKMEIGWRLFWVFALLYFAFPSARFYWDGVEYAQLAERAVNWREVLHPHHLFYNLLVLWVTRLIAIPLHVVHPGLVSQQWLNALLGAFGVMFFYRTTRYFFTDPLAWQLAAIGGSAYTWWLYSADHAPYIPSVFRLVLAFQLMVFACKDPLFKPGKLYMQGVNIFLAVMLHQAAVFFVPLYLYFLWVKTKETDDPAYYRVAGLTFSVGLIAFHYVLFGFVSLQLPDLPAFAHWVTEYGHDPRWWYLSDVSRQISELGSAIAKSHVATFLYPDYLYGDFHYAPAGTGLALALDCAKKLLLIVILWNGIPAVLGGFQHLALFLRLQPPMISRILTWWAILFFLFFAFFQPQQPFYRLFYFVPMLLLIGVGIDRGLRIAGKVWQPQAAWLLGALFLYNFGAGILPAHDPTKNIWLEEAKLIGEDIPPGTVVVITGKESFSLSEHRDATRMWELVEYLNGELPGPDHANAVEVVYAYPPDKGHDPIYAREYLQPEFFAPYERLWFCVGFAPPVEPAALFQRLEDHTFAHKDLEPRLSRWDQHL